MKRVRVILIAVGLCFSCSLSAEFIDAVVATVDKEVILHSDLMDELGPLLASMQSGAASEEEFNREADKAIRDALDQAIDYKILYREAVLAGIAITDEDVEKRMEEIIKQYDSRDAFVAMLTEAGETMSDVRDRMRKQIMALSMGMFKRRDFEKEAVIAEAEMRQYYQDHREDYVRPERLKLRRLFLSAEKEAGSRAEARGRLEALKEELALGADFGALAKAHSEGPEAEEGGLIGWVVRGDLVDVLEAAAFALTPGSVSDLVETEWGYHLLLVEEKEGAGEASFESVRTEIEPILRAEQGDERYRKWLQELRKRSRVRIFL